MACFNLAISYLQLDDMQGMLEQMAELELYLNPSMNVYKNLITSGFYHLLFKTGFIPKVLILEEILQLVLLGKQPNRMSEEQTKGSCS